MSLPINRPSSEVIQGSASASSILSMAASVSACLRVLGVVDASSFSTILLKRKAARLCLGGDSGFEFGLQVDLDHRVLSLVTTLGLMA